MTDLNNAKGGIILLSDGAIAAPRAKPDQATQNLIHALRRQTEKAVGAATLLASRLDSLDRAYRLYQGSDHSEDSLACLLAALEGALTRESPNVFERGDEA